MAEGVSSATATAILNALGNNTSFAVTEIWIQLHTGAPGAAGTSNVATETTRKQVSFGTAVAAAMANDTAIVWTNVPTADPDDYTHYTLWSASAAGTFHQSGTITANAVSDGDTFTIPIGDLDLTWSGVAS
jgi:hypothetical protein